MSGRPFSPQGPRTPHGHTNPIVAALFTLALAACALTPILVAAGVLER